MDLNWIRKLFGQCFWFYHDALLFTHLAIVYVLSVCSFYLPFLCLSQFLCFWFYHDALLLHILPLYMFCKYELYILYITCLYKVVYWPFPTSSPPPPSYIHQYHGNCIPLTHSFKPLSPVRLSQVNPHSIRWTPTCSSIISPSGHLISSHRPFPLTKCWLCTLCKKVVCMYLSFWK